MQAQFQQLDSRTKNIIRSIIRSSNTTIVDAEKQLAQELAKASSKFELTAIEVAKYNRLDNIYSQMATIMASANTEIKKELYAGLRRIYKVGFKGSIGIIENETGRTIRGIAKPELINDTIQSTTSGMKLSDRIHRNYTNSVFNVQQVVGQGINRGDSIPTMRKALREQLNLTSSQADRIVRTEAHRVFETAKYEGLEHATRQGVQLRKWWLTSQDERVRKEPSFHTQMGIKYSKENAIPFDDDFVNDATGGAGKHPGALGSASDDINCRCIMIIEVEEEVAEQTELTKKEKVLVDVEDKIRNRKTEKAYILDDDGNILLEKVGDEKSVRFTDREAELFRDATLTHNHPSGTAHSKADVLLAEEYKMKEIRAVGSKYNHSIKPPDSGWAEYYRNEKTRKIQTLSEHYDRKNQEIREIFIPQLEKGIIDINNVDELHQHRLWTELSEEIGIKYTREVAK